MNDEKWVNAPISKIVEAIMKATYPPQKLNPNYKKNYEVEQMRYRLKEALAPLGGEESFSLDDMRRVVKYALYIDGLVRDYPNLHSKKTQDEIISEALQTAIDIKSDECNTTSHPSERDKPNRIIMREALNDFIRMICDEFPSENWDYLNFIRDRYLAEKHKTEKK